MIWNKIIPFAIYFIIWAFLSWPADVPHVIAGVCVSALVVFLTGELFAAKPRNFRNIKRYPRFVVYVILLTWESVKGALSTAWLISRPKYPADPVVVKFKTSLKSETGIAFLSNSIAFLSGAFCIDADIEKGEIYVHLADANGRDMNKGIENKIRKFEGILKNIFE
ncbi:MAG: Na+/H+ antiporter subunit E [Candidatus Omnitrophota bacterium]|jgi:multicomponent Na+:H+ antiporter subunit E